MHILLWFCSVGFLRFSFRGLQQPTRMCAVSVLGSTSEVWGSVPEAAAFALIWNETWAFRRSSVEQLEISMLRLQMIISGDQARRIASWGTLAAGAEFADQFRMQSLVVALVLRRLDQLGKTVGLMLRRLVCFAASRPLWKRQPEPWSVAGLRHSDHVIDTVASFHCMTASSWAISVQAGKHHLPVARCTTQRPVPVQWTSLHRLVDNSPEAVRGHPRLTIAHDATMAPGECRRSSFWCK
jgi:hypothetical protein